MEFALSKIYTKFYICQILNALSFYDHKKKQIELQQLIEENYFSDSDSNKEDNNNNDVEMADANKKSDNNLNIKIQESIHNNLNVLKENLINYEGHMYRKYFVYKNVVYSKVEIQGIVIEKKHMGYEDRNSLRFLLYIDDSTGVIQTLSWKNKSESNYKKIGDELNPGSHVRILGQVDHFSNGFEVQIEHWEIIKNFDYELIFQKTLQRNQSAINDSNIFNLLNLDNNIYQELNDKKKYAHQKKDFANRLLAFFQRFEINIEKVKDGFIELEFKELFKIRQFNMMMEEFCNENRIEEKEKFLKECFNLLEEHSLGRLVNNEIMEIKVDDSRIKEEIKNLLRSSTGGKTYIEIFDEVGILFNNFFMNDYIKFILSQLVEECVIMAEQNKYQIIHL